MFNWGHGKAITLPLKLNSHFLRLVALYIGSEIIQRCAFSLYDTI